MAAAAALWWAYFDVVALAGEHRLRVVPEAAQSRIARDSYTYLHLPMVAGIVLFAVGLKESLVVESHELEAVVAASLCGGVALYLVALSTFKRRNYGTFNQPRLVAAALLLALAPIATTIPALAALALVAAIAVSLVAYEAIRYAEARQRIRHA
jgi:low temperature requirement protein LtrA